MGLTIEIYRSMERGPIILEAWDLDVQGLEADDNNPIATSSTKYHTMNIVKTDGLGFSVKLQQKSIFRAFLSDVLWVSFHRIEG